LSYLVLLAALYAAAALDATLPARTLLAGAAPQLVLLGGLCWICVYRGRRAYLGAAMAGLVADLAGSGRLGVCFALLASLALAVDALGRWLPLDRPGAQTAVVTIGAAAIVMVASCAAAMPAMADVPWSSLVGWSALTGAYTGMIGWPILILVGHRRRHAIE
jgi:cell shape-determining protein MreD